VVAVRLRLFRAHRRLREKLQDSSRIQANRMSYEGNRAGMASHRVREGQREDFVGLNAAEFACGD